jgi:pantoate--beta-alanine ligase
MKTLVAVEDLRATVAGWRRVGERVAFVPTMGNLHAGHLALVGEARESADRVVVSIFVNPMQFGAGEDFDTYPRTFGEDSARLQAAGVDLLFAPSVGTVYRRAEAERTRVEVPGLSDDLCGAARPGHFVGVATVVCKLCNMVQPDVALFGKKDYQQLMVIRRMVEDLDVPVEVRGVDTVREPDGLAMSSRNGYLTVEQRAGAAALHRMLQHMAGQLRAGRRDFRALEAAAAAQLDAAGWRTDYFGIRRAADLGRPTAEDREFVVLGAAYLGRTRLIDNLEVTLSV